jgi:hypothetical protein
LYIYLLSNDILLFGWIKSWKKMSFSSKTVSSETDEVNFDEKNIKKKTITTYIFFSFKSN